LLASDGAGYTITETPPAGFGDGLDARDGSVLPGSNSTDVIDAVILAAGGVAANNTFGELGGRITGTVFVDANINGALNNGEPGLGGVSLSALNSAGIVVATTVTAPDGTYSFIGLPPGSYTVVQTQPNGYASSTPNFLPAVVTGGGTTSNIDFGETLGSLTGRVFFDQDRDGVRDLGDPGIGGVQLQLTGTDANGLTVNRTTTTNSDGTYEFTGLVASDSAGYSITETQPPNFTDGQDLVGTLGGNNSVNDSLRAIPLTAGAKGTGYSFAEQGLIIAGTVFLDANSPTPNGTLDAGELGLGGITVSLRDSQGNIIAYAQTAPDGSYLFNLTALGRGPGSYSVAEVQPPAYGSSTPNSINVNVVNGTNGVTNVNFGDTLGSISGYVYLDANGTPSVRDANEAGIPGTTVTLTGTTITGQAVNLQTVTGPDGRYQFTGLLASNAAGYTITEAQPAGFTDGTDTRGTINGTAVGTVGNDVLSGVVLPGGGSVGPASQTAVNYNFGERPTAGTVVSGRVFVDANANGTLNPGEGGLVGITVELRRASDNGLVATTATDATGNYLFTGVTPGNYNIVQPTQPAGYDSTTPNTNTISNVSVPSTGLNNQNFGEAQGTLSGAVFVDLDNDGIRDPNEVGIPGVTVNLTGPASRTTTTGPDGSYSFTGLIAGTYTITEAQPTGHGDGLDARGGSVIGGSSTTDSITGIVLPVGGTVANNTFGERPQGINGRVFLDLDDDGVFESGEVGISGVLITLSGTDTSGNPVSRSTLTQFDGTYRFPDLPPGTYIITETQPAGFDDGKESNGDPNSPAPTVGNDVFSDIVVQPGALRGPLNFAERPQAGTGLITGTVFLDRDRSQAQGPSEPGQPGVLVELLNSIGTVIATTTADPDGNYAFFNLPPETYSVRLQNNTPPSGFGNSTPTSSSVTVAAGVPSVANFGLTLGSISGFVYRDLNINGVRNPGETGVANVIVNLNRTDITPQPVNRSTQTDINGRFSFDDLLSGDYTIVEPQSQPALANLYDGAQLALTANDRAVVDQNFDGLANNGEPLTGTRGLNSLSAIALAAGQAIVEGNFGEVPSVDPFGFVFLDRNNNGVRDAGVDTPIVGARVTISGTNALNGAALDAADINFGVDDNLDGDNDPFTRITDALGRWAFEVLPPGTFTVTEAQPAGFFDGPEQNADTSGAPAPTIGNDQFAGIALTPNQIRGPFNFGERLGSLSGRAFIDRNANNVLDARDMGQAGLIVTLTGRDLQGNFITRFATTDASGNYTFANLAPSDANGYRLSITAPTGFLRGRAFPGSAGGTAQTVNGAGLAIDTIVMGVNSTIIDSISNNFSLMLAGKRRVIGR